MNHKPILVIGGAVADLSVRPVDATIFERHSTPVPDIRLSTGGDALNEASVLARLGSSVTLLTLLGEDEMGALLRQRCAARGIALGPTVTTPEVATSINLVLVDQQGERRFVTHQNSSLRRLAPEHVLPAVEVLEPGTLVSFASLFVSPCFSIRDMDGLFGRIKERGCTLCADMTRPKNGEQAGDMAPALRWVDVLFANQEEAAALTGCRVPERAAQALRSAGARTVIVKLGKQGCCCAAPEKTVFFPAYETDRAIDTTGAGDSFAGGFLHGLSQSLPLEHCLTLGTAAASICVEHTGCASEALVEEKLRRRAAGLCPAPGRGSAPPPRWGKL